jgi:hypothetical protein
MRDFCVKLFHLMRGVHIRCFCTLKVHEKIDMRTRVDFWFRVEFGFWGGLWGFFEAMTKFVMVFRVFYKCFGSKTGCKISFWVKRA